MVVGGSSVTPHPSPLLHLGVSAISTRQKVLVLDLDETLIFACTTTAGMAVPPTFSEVVPTMTGATLYHVWERPHLQHFLSTVTRWYTVVLFTAASQAYADALIDRVDRIRMLDGKKRIRRRFYRTECTFIPRRAEDGKTRAASAFAGDGTGASSAGMRRSDPPLQPSSLGGNSAQLPQSPSSDKVPMILSKDLSQLRVAMDSVILVDNSPACLRINPENGLLCPSFYPPRTGNPQEASSERSGSDGVTREKRRHDDDDYLFHLLVLLEALAFVPDVRAILRFGINVGERNRDE